MAIKILIIKLGALGDVLRTTPILRELRGQITWVSHAKCLPLLVNNPFISNILTLEQIKNGKNSDIFDLILSLDDEYDGCDIASRIKSKKVIGSYLNDNHEKCYTVDSAKWFDMGLISRFGLDRANELKKANTETYQKIVFEMMGLEFKGQEYILPYEPKIYNDQITIGIETRAGNRWPMKIWPRYKDLISNLSNKNNKVVIFGQRHTLESYIEDVNSCDIIITGDTLCMHLGLALKKQVIAFFGPTSADEIFDYGRLIKIISPAPCIKCYKNGCSEMPSCMDLISIDMVIEAIETASKRVLMYHDKGSLGDPRLGNNLHHESLES